MANGYGMVPLNMPGDSTLQRGAELGLVCMVASLYLYLAGRHMPTSHSQ